MEFEQRHDLEWLRCFKWGGVAAAFQAFESLGYMLFGTPRGRQFLPVLELAHP